MQPPEPFESPTAVEMTTAQFIALAESDREAAIRLMWPDEGEAEAMRLLDAVAFDGFIEALKANLQAEDQRG